MTPNTPNHTRRSKIPPHLLLTASALAAGTTAHGSVVLFENINLTIAPNSPDGTLDLNLDSTVDFRFNFGKNSGKQPYLDPAVQPPTGPALDAAVLTKGNMNDGIDRGITVTASGQTISAETFAGHNGRSGYFHANFGDDNEIVGDWGAAPSTTGFVGLRIRTEDQSDFYYGWANFTYVTTPGAESLTLNYYAYDNEPGQGIVTAVPEPSAVGCLILGAAGAASFRRRRALN